MEYSAIWNFLEYHSRKEYSKKIHRIRGTVPLGWNAKGIPGNKETIQLIKTHNEDRIHTILHFSTNIICFLILSGYSILGNQELIILNSWFQEFLYNLSDTIEAFSILLLTDLCIGFHSTHGWELMIGSVYKDFGFAQNDQIISGLVSTFPVILDTILKYWIFRYLNRVSPSLVVIYHFMNDWKNDPLIQLENLLFCIV